MRRGGRKQPSSMTSRCSPMMTCIFSTRVLITVSKTGSIVWDTDYQWGDQAWMDTRAERNTHMSPISVYELHFGSWRRTPEEGRRSLTYREMAPELVAYMAKMGFTHVQFLPIMEHP